MVTPADPTLLPIVTAATQSVTQSESIDWVQITATATPQRLSTILRDQVDLATRWGVPFQDCLKNIIAIVFLKQDTRAAMYLSTKSTDTVLAEIAAAEDVYLPAVRIFDKFITGSGNGVLAIHTALPLRFD